MKKNKLTQKKAQVHIRLVNPNSTRRLILNSALDTGRLIKDASEIHKIREQKYKTLKKLGRVLREIKILEKQLTVSHMPEFTDNEMTHLMPHEHHKLHNEVKSDIPTPQKTEANKHIQKQHPKTEAEKLKDELQAIEDKLKSLQ